jgi:hypothetical protein
MPAYTGGDDYFCPDDQGDLRLAGVSHIQGSSSIGSSEVSGEIPAYFQTTLDRLLEQKVEGSLVVVNPTPVDELTLFQFNDYPEFELTLNPQWTTYLDGSYEVYFTIMRTLNSTNSLLESQGTIVDQATCTISFPITVEQMDIDHGQYVWQVQLRKPNPNPLLAPLSLKVTSYGHVFVRPTFKGIPDPVVP